MGERRKRVQFTVVFASGTLRFDKLIIQPQLPQQLVVHGHLFVDGTKMSRNESNVGEDVNLCGLKIFFPTQDLVSLERAPFFFGIDKQTEGGNERQDLHDAKKKRGGGGALAEVVSPQRRADLEGKKEQEKKGPPQNLRTFFDIILFLGIWNVAKNLC